MTNSKIIQTYLDYGLDVRCMMALHNGPVILIFSDEVNLFISSKGSRYTDKELDMRVETVSITPLARKPKAYEYQIRETKALVLEAIKEAGISSMAADQIAGKIGKIVGATGYGYLYKVEVGGCVYEVPYWCLAPHIEKEEKMVEIMVNPMDQKYTSPINPEQLEKRFCMRAPISIVKKALEAAEKEGAE